MKRPVAGVLAALVVASALTAAVTPAAAASGAFISVNAEATPDPAPPGSEVTVSTTVENLEADGDRYKLQRVELQKTRTGNGSEVASQNLGRFLGEGESVTVNLSEEFERTGEFDRYVHLKFISNDGRVITMVRPVSVTVEQSHPATSLSADRVGSSGEADFSLTVANGLPAEVRGLTVELASDDVTLTEDRHVVSSLRPGNEATIDVPVRNVSAGTKTVEMRLTYLTADGESRSVTRTLSATVENDGEPAQIDLTGRRISQEGDTVVVRGSAANVGSTNASSVKIAVAEGEDVVPAQNQASFFVGEVKASDYSSFEVHARLTADTNQTVTVPLEVSYSDDGQRITRTVDVAFTPATTPDAAARQSSSGPLVPAILGLVVVVVVGGLGWRRYR